MNVEKAIQIVDLLIFEQAGKHMTNIQRVIILELWEDADYFYIANKYHCSESYVRDSAYKLWKILSAQLGEKISKSNFRSTIERLYSNTPSINSSSQLNYDRPLQSVCQNILDQKLFNSSLDKKITINKYHYFGIAPKIINFFDRQKELKSLSNAIFKDQAQLITVSGFTGIGKTTLVKHFVDLYKDEFDLIIWESFARPKKLGDFLASFFQKIHKVYLSEHKKLCDFEDLLELFQELKCLVIFDDIHNLFAPQKLSGIYQDIYQDYPKIFHIISQVQHKSNLILISQEKIVDAENNSLSEYELDLQGFNVPVLAMFKSLNFKDKKELVKLNNLYQGNCLFLNSITLVINQIFCGSIESFFLENTLFIPQEIALIFKQLFTRLSVSEIQIIMFMTKDNGSFTVKQIRDSLSLSTSEIINGILSLNRRYLVEEKNKNGISSFSLDLLFREYIINFLYK